MSWRFWRLSSIIQCTLCDVPLSAKQPQSIMLPPPCLTSGTVFLGLKAFGLLMWAAENVKLEGVNLRAGPSFLVDTLSVYSVERAQRFRNNHIKRKCCIWMLTWDSWWVSACFIPHYLSVGKNTARRSCKSIFVLIQVIMNQKLISERDAEVWWILVGMWSVLPLLTMLLTQEIERARGYVSMCVFACVPWLYA